MHLLNSFEKLGIKIVCLNNRKNCSKIVNTAPHLEDVSLDCSDSRIQPTPTHESITMDSTWIVESIHIDSIFRTEITRQLGNFYEWSSGNFHFHFRNNLRRSAITNANRKSTDPRGVLINEFLHRLSLNWVCVVFGRCSPAPKTISVSLHHWRKHLLWKRRSTSHRNTWHRNNPELTLCFH